MSYIRQGEDRTYFDGKSNVYVYPSGGAVRYGEEPSPDLKREGASVQGRLDRMTETDLAEIALRMVEDAGVDDDTFEQVRDAMQETYPRTFEIPPSAPQMAEELAEHEQQNDWSETQAINYLEVTFPTAAEVKMEVAYQLWEEEHG